MPKANQKPRIAQVKQELLRIFVERDISQLSEPDADLIQKVMAGLINPPALSRLAPRDDDYRAALQTLQKTPKKAKDAVSPLPESGFGLAEISLVLQGLAAVQPKPEEKGMIERTRKVLKNMAGGNKRVWKELGQSLDPTDIAVYSFLKDALKRARSADAGRMERAPKQRSQKRFWDGGVSI